MTEVTRNDERLTRDSGQRCYIFQWKTFGLSASDASKHGATLQARRDVVKVELASGQTKVFYNFDNLVGTKHDNAHDELARGIIGTAVHKSEQIRKKLFSTV